MVTIQEHAFYDSGITHIELNDGLTTIGKEAFQLYNNLDSIFIPASVSTIGSRALGYGYNETKPLQNFTVFYENETSCIEDLKKLGITCELGTRTSGT